MVNVCVWPSVIFPLVVCSFFPPEIACAVGRRVIIKARAFPRSFKNGGLNRRFSPMVIWSSYRVEYRKDILKHRPSYQGNKLRFFKKIFYCEKVIIWYYVLQNFVGNRVELRFVEY